jgi:hypothetical protein
MNGTTDEPKVFEFSPGYLKWLYALTIAAMVFIFFIVPAAKQTFRLQDVDFMPPHIAAGGLIVHQGISEFQTGRPEPIPAATTRKIFLSLLVNYVVAPTVVIFYLLRARRRKEQGMPDEKAGVKNALVTFAFIISSILVAITILTTAAGSYGSSSTFTRMKKENDGSYQRGMLSKQMMNAYVDCMQYYYQTERYGGRKRNIIVAGAASVRSPEELGMKAEGEFGTLVVEPVYSDTVIVLAAVGRKRGYAERFRNADGDSGKIQCSLTIRPSSHTYEIRQDN